MIKELVKKTRCYRRFFQDETIRLDTLKELVELARLSSSASNLQPLKYLLSCDPGKNSLIFPHLGWAGYLADWHGPEDGERPSAYIIALGDTTIARSFDRDLGMAAQNILLGATEKGLGGCVIGSVQRPELKKSLDIPGRFEILVVLALGKPKEKVVLETVRHGDDIKYWRDEDGVHHVPKRPLEEIIIG